MNPEAFRASGAAVLAALTLSAGAAVAEVVRFTVIDVETPAFGGRRFADVGQYERLTARVTMAVDPTDPRNAAVVDLDLAPRNAAGRVEYASRVVILRPVEGARANRRIFFTVVNRGNPNSLPLFLDAPRWDGGARTRAAGAGNGSLMRAGYTLVWSGWQADVAAGDGRLRLEAPVVEGVTGIARDEFVFDHTDDPAVATLGYPAADRDPAKASLSVRQRPGDPRQHPRDLAFDYRTSSAGRTQIVIQRPAGFDAGAIYELIYPARDPVVMGLGFAATRDIVSFLRRAQTDAAGTPNPLARDGEPEIEYAYAFGRSQSGRYLRDFLYQGFNEDEDGRRVFDGLMPHIAGSRRMFTNARFARPGVYSKQHEDHLTPGDQFPFSYVTLTDALTGRRDGILARCQTSGTCPKVIHTDTATEYWQARASLVVTDTRGADLALPSNVRVYLFASVPHGSQNTATGSPLSLAACRFPSNPLHVGAPMRALLRALDRWVSDGIEPPASRHPRRADHTLVASGRRDVGFPSVPDLPYAGLFNPLRVVDYAVQPPAEGATYPVFVPTVDADGNDVPGIRIPWVDMPVGTYLGWNLRRRGFAGGELCHLNGSFVPFAATRAERQDTKDPRLSLEERYSTRRVLVDGVRRAAQRLVRNGFLLEEDAEWFVERARLADVGSSP